MRKLIGMLVIAFAVLVLPGQAIAQWTTIKGEDESEWKRVIRTDTKGRVQGVQAQKSLDTCDSTDGWSALNSDTDGLSTDLDHVQGSNSLEFDKVDGTSNTVFGAIQKTITAVDVSQYMENNGWILFSLNVSATTDIAYCFIRLGTDNANYNEWRVDDDALAAGWQQIRFSFYSPDTAGNTGNGMDASAITYVALGCGFDAETDTLADLRVDNIAVNSGFQTSADLSSQVSSATATPNVNVVKIASQPVDIGLGNAGVGTQRTVNATDDPNLSKLTVEDYDTGAGTINKQVVGIVFPGSGAVVPAPGDTSGADVDINAQSLTALKVSKDANANSATNPIIVQPSDGTAVNAQGNPLYSVVSKDTNANALTNPIYTQTSADGTNAVSATAPFFVRQTDGTAANAVDHPAWSRLSQDGTNPVDATHPLPISLNLTLNAVTNPIWFRISQDGTNPMDATHPLSISKDLSLNAVTNPIAFRLSIDGTNWLGPSNPLPISKDAAANATGNRIYTHGNIDQVSGTALTLGEKAATASVPVVLANDKYVRVSDDTAANTATNPMFFQPTDGTAVNAQGNPIYAAVSKDTSANALANPIYVLLSDGTTPFYVAPATAAGMSKSENGIKVEAVAYLDNGTSLDPAKAGATGEMQVTDVAVRPGENPSLNAREMKVAYLGTSEPTKVGPTAVDDTALSVTTGTVILGPTKVLPNGRLCVYVKNVGGGSGNALSDVEIYDSPDGSSGWDDANTWTSCDGLTSGTKLCKKCVDDPWPWIQVKARCAAGEDTTAEAWLRQVRR